MPTPDTDQLEHHFPGPGPLGRTLDLVRFLRANCPWDAKQTAESLIPHLLEESHEVVDAIREGTSDDLEGELGDLMLNLAFQIVVAEEKATMTGDSVYARLEAKMIRRHPHLFGDAARQEWEELKAAERPEHVGVLDGLPSGLDPLTKAFRIQQKVAAVGFDWPDHRGAQAKVSEELEEAREAIEAEAPDQIEEEVGDLLFAAVNLARLAGSHPTTALAAANAKFRVRFERLEELAADRGIVMTTAGLDVLDGLWNEVKRRGSAKSGSVDAPA